MSGTVDLLALFRCISCRFKFTTDVTDPSNMVGGRQEDDFLCTGVALWPNCSKTSFWLQGVVGRVFASGEVRA